MRLRVMVAPVALVPAEADQLRLMAFAPSGDFLVAEVPGGQNPQECGRELVTASEDALRLEREFVLEEVAFTATPTGLMLLYTAVLPLADGWQREDHPLGRDPSLDWTLLTPWVGRGETPEPENLSPEQCLVRNYWRRQLTETSAVLDFLPRYFTTSQARAAYSSLWGEQQHVGAFHRWFHDRAEPKTTLVTSVSDDEVRGAAEDAFTKALKRSDLGPQMELIGDAMISVAGRGAAVRPGVGLSAAMVAGGALGFLPAAMMAGAIAGSLVAYQQRVGRGKKSLWFTRTTAERILIDDPYAPRPRWLSTGTRPGAFH